MNNAYKIFLLIIVILLGVISFSLVRSSSKVEKPIVFDGFQNNQTQSFQNEIAENTNENPLSSSVTGANSNQITVRGWLRSATRLQEVAFDYNPNTDNDAYSGRNFSLNFSNTSRCYIYTSATSKNEISCFQLDEGRGNINDRMKITGILSDDKIEVSILEDVNNLPVAQWKTI